MSTRSLLSSVLAFSLALGPVTAPSFAAPEDQSWHISKDEHPTSRPEGIDKIKTVVVIYGENRSFDNLYGLYPGADGIANALRMGAYKQYDRNGKLLKTLPKIWGGLPGWTEAQTANLANEPFAIDNPKGFNVPLSTATGDLVHRFYQNQMQIDGGKNDKFAAWSDAGGLTMGYYLTSPSQLPMWKVAQQNVLADNFFYGSFGGSFLNHQWLICACSPVQANPNDNRWSVVDAVKKGYGTALTTKSTSPASALDGAPQFVSDGALTPQGEGKPYYAVNTSQPPYQPSGNLPATGGDKAFADPSLASTVWPLNAKTIGDVLSDSKVNVDWAWYAGAWQAALDSRNAFTDPKGPLFQPHHQPFNYYKAYAPGTKARAQHLRDGGLDGAKFIADIDAGKLPAVTFYKPQGSLNEHPGYADVLSGDKHIATVISHLQKSPQWKNMLVVVTYDENGGFWDHVSPPKGDRWGPGSRIPTIIVSPYAKAGWVDHTPYDTTSILRFIIKRFVGNAHEPIYPGDVLPGIADRDRALKANGFRRPGDLTNALYLN